MLQVSREKHLDHMVKVVPFIVTCYAIQCYVILQMKVNGLSVMSLSILGGVLAIMIGAFIVYDLKHKVTLYEDRLVIQFLGREKTVAFDEILSLTIKEPGESFNHLTVVTGKGKFTIFFIDDAQKIKNWIEERKSATLSHAA